MALIVTQLRHSIAWQGGSTVEPKAFYAVTPGFTRQGMMDEAFPGTWTVGGVP